ncbi:amino acid permease [Raoultella sp. Lac2]|uniref:Amino acid permease n=2 Tax=Enterobacteriaceae TaxID=543 RepID=A0AAJ5UCQ7_9ENTR|nr:amino acid permease [Klebsiella electrica]MXF44994.1 amino acid permease [Raoultella sp. Lac2]MXF97591.1 amino acid permease [Raoultella sp. Lac1]BBV77445.1 amino acid permease [Raoultella planticola]QDI09549.1 putative amino acid permease YhdG [Klebsiella electrica]WBW59901.1 amino acid permease [Klebsiella electrica]
MKHGVSLKLRLMRKKPIDDMVEDASAHGSKLGRSITLFQLTMFGVGATIGTGIFFVLSEQVPVAGPAVLIAFLIAGLTAGLTALCYAEMSSMIPASGSSYSYAYVTLGEGIAFLVAACLILEYGISAAAVAIGWSEYLHNLIFNISGLELPRWMLSAPLVAEGYNLKPGGDGLINLPAACLVFLCCLLLMRGSKESARTNAIMVVIKLGVLLLFIALAATSFNAGNLLPFAPHGFAGISAAAGSIFFTFVGLDAVSTAGEEVKNPKRNLPIAIISALLIVTVFYILVALMALGAQSQSEFKGQEAGLALILQHITGATWPAVVLSAGAVVSVFSITLVVLYGQTRILFAMSRDGLLPKIFHKVNPRTMTPNMNTAIVACFVSAIAAFLPSSILWDLTSMGTLVAFTVVSAGVIVLRYSQPDAPRGFKVPFFPLLPILSIIACLYLISSLSLIVFKLTAIWAILAALFYLTYSVRHSRLEKKRDGQNLANSEVAE